MTTNLRRGDKWGNGVTQTILSSMSKKKDHSWIQEEPAQSQTSYSNVESIHPPPILVKFYRRTIESIQTSCISVWSGNWSGRLSLDVCADSGEDSKYILEQFILHPSRLANRSSDSVIIASPFLASIYLKKPGRNSWCTKFHQFYLLFVGTEIQAWIFTIFNICSC